MSICHLAELDSDMLYLYGPGSLDALDRNWGNQAVQAVTAISFKFIDFDLIVPQLYKIRARFPSLVVSMFRFANISIAGIFLENNETSICQSVVYRNKKTNTRKTGMVYGKNLFSCLSSISYYRLFLKKETSLSFQLYSVGRTNFLFVFLQGLVFTETNIRALHQMNSLSLLRRLDHLSITDEGNPVTSFSLWRPYVLFRLAHFSLRKINDIEVS